MIINFPKRSNNCSRADIDNAIDDFLELADAKHPTKNDLKVACDIANSVMATLYGFVWMGEEPGKE